MDIEAIFPNLSETDQTRLLSVVERRSYPAGSVLLEEGRPSDSIYLIGEGLVTVTKSVGASEIVVAELTVGDVAGEISFVDGGPVSATVTATTDVEALLLPKAAIQKLAEESPEFGVRLYRALGTALSLRLRQTTDQYLVVVP